MAHTSRFSTSRMPSTNSTNPTEGPSSLSTFLEFQGVDFWVPISNGARFRHELTWEVGSFVVCMTASREESSLSESVCVSARDFVELCVAELYRNHQKNISNLPKVSKMEELMLILPCRVSFINVFTIQMQEKSVVV